ncbi:MAG TPA: type ISP restriction/modification enzyme [Planctomycetota bacterium]
MQKQLMEYLRAVERELKPGDATEHTHRPHIKRLLEELAPSLTATNEPKRSACGAPDFVVREQHGALVYTLGYMETKDIGTSLDEAENSDQLKRYRRALGNLILTDYLEFRHYVDGILHQSARLATLTTTGRTIKVIPFAGGGDDVFELLKGFIGRTPEKITRPAKLASEMARLTHLIRDIIVETFTLSKASDQLQGIRTAFAEVLIPDLSVPEKLSEFADMYAQTIAYGLFAARCNHSSAVAFSRTGAALEIPKTNPFLKKFFETITGTELADEPYAGFVDDLALMLGNTDMDLVLAEFGKRTRKEDPVIHFYETFLLAYDPEVRAKRGVYYTPEPVVQYITESVDLILKKNFHCAQGVACTDLVTYKCDVEVGNRVEKRDAVAPKVLILDPACGTGTFLYSIIDNIRESFIKARNAGMWSGYVKEHLLSRIFGFELLIAPYSVAHFKLGMQLAGFDLPANERKAWRYDCSSGDRLNVFLTNTLDEAERKTEGLFGLLKAISEEANGAARIKRDLPIMVILGNPPYSGESANKGEWILALMNGKDKTTGQKTHNYFHFRGKPLGETQVKWIYNDYVKFIRFAQWRIEQTGSGILAFITDNGYLENTTFRGVREALLDTFNDVFLLNLHGCSKPKEVNPNGGKDENVFDIQQGVAISLFIRDGSKRGRASLHYADLWGTREQKYDWLSKNTIASTEWETFTPEKHYMSFVPQRTTAAKAREYDNCWSIRDIFRESTVGIVTARDHLCVKITGEEVLGTVRKFVSLPAEEARQHFGLGRDARDWKVVAAQKDVSAVPISEKFVLSLLYHPYDRRFTYYTGRSKGFIGQPQKKLMHHMIAGPNLAICTVKSVEISRGWEHVFCADTMIQHHCVSSKEVNYMFPVYLYPDADQELLVQKRSSNFKGEFILHIERLLGLKFIDEGEGNFRRTVGPEDIFYYIYAVLHSSSYRNRFQPFLKFGFPRVPIVSDRSIFKAIAEFGYELTTLHLLASPSLNQSITRFPVSGDNKVERGFPHYVAAGETGSFPGPASSGRIYLNRTPQYFENVRPEIWNYHVGGYRVCERWLKDRQGRMLTYDDLTVFQKIVSAISRTLQVIDGIEAVLPGWPLK